MKKILISGIVLVAAAAAGWAILHKSDKGGEVKTLPIMAWYSIPAEDASLERYQELAECGFNLSFSHLKRLDEVKTALDLGGQTGIGIMATCKELRQNPESTVRAIMDHPALYGYFLRDEPSCADFQDLGEWADQIRAVDGRHMLYLNLFPNFVGEGIIKASYREYVHRFIEEVRLPMVSFDHYPVTFGGINKDVWYRNFEVIRDESEAAGLPFWAFALSTAHDPYPLPTMASLRIELYTALAYGAQGIQYFTYWNPGTTTWNFHEAPINQNKERSEAYGLVQAMNRELQARANVFVGAKVTSVAHTGKVIPQGCKALDILPEGINSLTTSGEGAIVSTLKNGRADYLMVVNRDLNAPTTLDIEFERRAGLFRSTPAMIDREGKAVNLDNKKVTLTIGEGDAIIFRY